ncbi:MAG: HAMP domain-containing histidine kinase [Bacteroidaceae bacterium]|nr:HAMP domain-containing histidine kinase [Bacteroidaceae bacterium]
MNKRHYQKVRQQRVDSLEQIVNSCHIEEYVEKCKELYRVLSHFDGREALKVLKRIEKTEEYQQDPNLQAWVKLNESVTYGIMGLYHSADNLTASIDPSELSREEQLHYYLTYRYNYERIAEYMAEISIMQDEEKQMVTLYDKILELVPEGYEKDIVTANKAVYLHQPEKAVKVLTERFPKAQGMDRCRMGMALAFANEQLNNRQDYIYYLASTALCNLKFGFTTYEALPYLAHALHDEGDINRAYNYLMCTMEDANTYPSRRLALGVSKYFPLINSSYRSHKAYVSHNEQMKRNSLIIIFTMLALSLGIAFFLGWKQTKAAEERRRANQLQRALDQAEIADRVKTVFIQNMRHEIRTPLNAIMGFAQLMSNDLSEEERATYNGYIRESNDQLLSTLDDIIEVSNMETGEFNFQFEEINIDELCLAHIEDNKELLLPDVKIFYKPQEEGITLCSDKKRIGQVLDNLISNACKNTSSGKITLKVAHYTDREKLQFVVTDTGTGVPPEKAEVIFEHFEKIDHYSPGLGLGLYVCRLIARALGGDIYLDTTYTNGARFVFTVPNYIPSSEDEEEKHLELLEIEA